MCGLYTLLKTTLILANICFSLLAFIAEEDIRGIIEEQDSLNELGDASFHFVLVSFHARATNGPQKPSNEPIFQDKENISFVYRPLLQNPKYFHPKSICRKIFL